MYQWFLLNAIHVIRFQLQPANSPSVGVKNDAVATTIIKKIMIIVMIMIIITILKIIMQHLYSANSHLVER